jgi:hypothetical protein
MKFITDYLRIMVSGNLNSFEIENLMDVEIETHHNEAHAPIAAIVRLGDALACIWHCCCCSWCSKYNGICWSTTGSSW